MSFKYPKEVRGIHSKVIIVLIIWYQYALVWHEFYGMNLVAFISNWCCPFSNRGAITQSVRSVGGNPVAAIVCWTSVSHLQWKAHWLPTLTLVTLVIEQVTMFICRIYLRGTLIDVKYRLYESWFFDFLKRISWVCYLHLRTPVTQGNVRK